MLNLSAIRFILLIFLFSQFEHALSSTWHNADNERVEVLDPNGKYRLIWSKDFDTQTIKFTVIVETLGFVGFGISPNGGMAGADIVIAGVLPDGTAYFEDRYATTTALPEVDRSQDWELLEHSETSTHTTLTFSRLFNTCDEEQDYPIGNDTSNVIWAFGETDTIGYHLTNRGSFSVNLLDPAMPPFDETTVSTWTMGIDFVMPPVETTYWCTIHKSPPSITTKNHIIGFEPNFPTEVARTHTHHFIVHECKHPTGGDLGLILDPVMETDGGHCYLAGEMSQILVDYCRTYLFVWAVGGRRTIFPDHVGYPVGENPLSANYYMLEIHYNNPGELSLPKFVTGLNMFHTTELRDNEAGTLTVGHDISVTHFLPPRVQSFMTVGHCSSECTAAAVGAGINVFNVLLHSHLVGRRLKSRHYRNGVELPWMSVDDNYNFDFQQNRPLKQEIQILPGDQFAYECVYDTTSRQNVTIGGFASEEEMCQTFLAYYPKMSTNTCGSEYDINEFLPYFGIESVRNNRGEPDPIVTAPEHLVGQRFTEVANRVHWTNDKVVEMQDMLRFSKHIGRCSGSTIPRHSVGYLEVPEEYKPENPCMGVSSPPTDGTTPPTPGCSQTFTDTWGNFYSPEFPLHYPFETECEWRFLAPQGYRIHITLGQQLSLEHHRECEYDYLEFRDGPNPDSPIITKICGYHEEPLAISSTSNSLYARFYSDDQFNAQGFVGIYQMRQLQKFKFAEQKEDN